MYFDIITLSNSKTISFKISKYIFVYISIDYCSGGAWKLPSGKYVCFVDPAISDFKTQFEVAIMKEDPKTGMNRLCIENGLDHMIEPRTHEDAVMFTKLQHCIE